MNLYIRDVTKLKTIEKKVAWVLETYPHLKDENNNELTAMFWKIYHHVDISPKYIAGLTAVESIARARRYLKARDPYKYGGTKHHKVIAKATHQLAIEEWVTQT